MSIEEAVELARSREISHQVGAAATMRDMAARHSSQVLEAGGVQALLHLLATSHWKQVHHAAATALASLAAANRGVRDTVIQAGGCATLVRLLSDREPRTQEAAAAAVWSLSVGGRAALCALAAAGAAQPLVKLMRSNVAVRLAAASALYNLAHEPAAAAAIAAAGPIPVLIHQLTVKRTNLKGGQQKEELRQVQAAAAGTLWCLADGQPESRAAIGAGGGVQALVNLLTRTLDSGNDSGASFQVAGCLCCLAQDSSLRDALRIADCAEPLVRLLRSGSDDGREQAAGALWRLARGNEAGAAAVADAGAIVPLVLALGSTSQAVQHQAAGCLRSLCSAAAGAGEAEARRVAVKAAGARSALQRLVRASPGTETAVEACGALAELDASFPEPGSGAGIGRTCRACSSPIDTSDAWALAPCGHRGLCHGCATELVGSQQGCPVCCQASACLAARWMVGLYCSPKRHGTLAGFVAASAAAQPWPQFCLYCLPRCYLAQATADPHVDPPCAACRQWLAFCLPASRFWTCDRRPI